MSEGRHSAAPIDGAVEDVLLRRDAAHLKGQVLQAAVGHWRYVVRSGLTMPLLALEWGRRGGWWLLGS